MSEFNLKRTLSEIKSLEAMGMTETQTAEKLNLQNLKTPRGLDWNRMRLASFKAHRRNRMQARAPRPALKLPKFAKKPATGGGLADDMAVLALRRSDWSDKKKLKVVSAILAD